MIFEYSTSTNHYGKYQHKKSDKISVLVQDLATRCFSPVTKYGDKELTSVDTGKTWISKQHRTNATIEARGNLGMIDFEGKKEKLEELLRCIENRDLFYIAIPSQSNKSDKRNSRYHIIYKLATPYTINSEAYKIQAKEFFVYVRYKWDEPESGIDTRASFNGCGYFAPTIQLTTDKGKGAKKISDPYLTADDITKDTIISRFKGEYQPIDPESIAANEAFTTVTKRGRKIDEKHTKIVKTLAKGYVLSPGTHIETSSGRFMTFEKLVDVLLEVEGENPRIGGLGCPICNKNHTADDTTGYGYMQYDNEDIPYICCTGNACELRPFYTMADGNIQVYRVDDAAGIVKYAMFEDEQIIYTHDRDMTYKLSPEALSDELYNRGQGITDENGYYNRGHTIGHYCHGAESVQLNHNPFAKGGLDIYSKTFTVSPDPIFEPIPGEPNKVVAEAIKGFDDDAIICGYPVSLVYLSYYLFHHKQIMAVLFLVNPDRGSGKSFWVLDLPQWYLGYSKVAGISSGAIRAGWDDEKLGKRVVVYEDVENLNKSEMGALKSGIKSDATAGDSKYLNIKGQGKKRSFGFNSAGTSNHYNQIPFDGRGDRRIYPAPYKKLDTATWLASELRSGSKNMEENRTNAINFLYKIYTECEKSNDKDLQATLYYRVPESSIRGKVEDSTSTDGHTAMNIIRRAKRPRKAIKGLSHIIASEIKYEELKELVNEIEFLEDEVRIKGTTLHNLWEMLPSGRNNTMRSVSQRALLQIFNIGSEVKSVRIKGVSNKGIIIKTS